MVCACVRSYISTSIRSDRIVVNGVLRTINRLKFTWMEAIKIDTRD